MKHIYQCSVTGKQFTDERECLNHEIESRGIPEAYKGNFEKALKSVASKFEVEVEIVDFKVCAYVDFDDFYEIVVDYTLSSPSFESLIRSTLKDHYDFHDFKVKSSEEFAQLLTSLHFTPKLQNKYVGVFFFEDYMGGHGADDYLIGHHTMRSIYNAFAGKTVELKVIE